MPTIPYEYEPEKKKTKRKKRDTNNSADDEFGFVYDKPVKKIKQKSLKIKKKKKKYKKDKRVLKINAPVVMVPDQKDRLLPVLTDRYFMDDIFKHFEKKKLPLIDHWLEEGKLALVFESKEQAILFKLEFPGYRTWRENATTVGEGFYNDDYRPDPFPQRNC